MQRELLKYLCDPIDKSALSLSTEITDETGNIIEGVLTSASGRTYPIHRGVPRFLPGDDVRSGVASFGEEWNFFNFDQFKVNWLGHTVANTFGSADVFKGQLIVDAGGGSGMQSKWIRELGARHVICLELSSSVDDVIQRNLKGIHGVDVVQCSIDMPPIRNESIAGIVICHNVIQHTESVEATALALWNIVAPGGEFVFNCYPRNDAGVLRALRYRFYLGIRALLKDRGFRVRLAYAYVMATLRLVPLLGVLIEKAGLANRGDVPRGPGYYSRAFRQTALNTFDGFGGHRYQHQKSDEEIRVLVAELQPDGGKVRNAETYFAKPQPIGCALRLMK